MCVCVFKRGTLKRDILINPNLATMLKYRGFKTLLTYSFLVIMMMINEAIFSSLKYLPQA